MDCNIIRDLLPLYVDGIASPQSTAAVRAHLAECEACAEHAALLRTALPAPAVDSGEALKRIRRRQTAKTALPFVLFLLIILFVFFKPMNTMKLLYGGSHPVTVTVDAADGSCTEYHIPFDDVRYAQILDVIDRCQYRRTFASLWGRHFTGFALTGGSGKILDPARYGTVVGVRTPAGHWLLLAQGSDTLYVDYVPHKLIDKENTAADLITGILAAVA